MTDSALSSACRLHTSIGSLNSSTSSLHRRRLGEITEDAEEDGGERRKSGLRHSILSDADSGFKEGSNSLSPQAPTTSNHFLVSHLPKRNNSSTSASHASDVPADPTLDKLLPATPGQTPRKTVDGKADVGEGHAAVEELIPPTLEDQRPSLDSRRSTQSTRPSASELDRANLHSGYTPHRPKIKLGPRPSAQRPRTPGSRGEVRPVANLPSSVRISTRPPSSTSWPPSSASHRPTSQQSNRSARSNFTTRYDPTPPPPLPQPSIHISALYQPPNLYLLNRPASPAPSVTTSIAPSITTTGPPGITPEKQRLLRALQLRKKQQMAKINVIKPPSPPAPTAPSHETLKKPVVSSLNEEAEPSQIKEDSNQQSRKQATQVASASSQMAASNIDFISPVSTAEASQKPVEESHTAAESIEPRHLDSSLNSKDEEAISSTMDSESATSEGTLPSRKSTTIVQSKSPVLPPMSPQNRLGIGVSFPSPEQDSERAGQIRSIVNPAATAEEEEKTDTTVQPSSPKPAFAKHVAAAEELSPPPKSAPPLVPIDELSLPLTTVPTSTSTESLSQQPEPAPPVTEDERSSPHKVKADNAGEDTPGVSTTAKDINSRSADRSTRRRGTLESQKAVGSAGASDTSDDESLYDELQTATVEEAHPVMVARSPINAVFNRGSPDRQREHNRSISIPSRKTDDSSKSTPEKAKGQVGRGLSSVLPQWPPVAEPAQSLLIKKANVSTGITKRIKALEMFSGSSPTSAAPPSPPLTTGLVKKRMSSHSPNETLVRNMSARTPPAKQLQYPSPAPTPTPAPAAADNQPLWLQRNGSTSEVLAPRGKGDSISVTARIVRDPTEVKQNKPSNPSKPVAMNLHQSPLVVEREKAERMSLREALRVVEPAGSPIVSREPDPTPTGTPRPARRRVSLSSTHSNSGKMALSESFTKRLSTTIRHARTESGNLRSESSNLPRSASDSSSIAEDKFPRESRKSRLMRRMSVLTAGPRRGLAVAFGSNSPRQDEPASIMSYPPYSIAEHSGEVSPEDPSMTESHAHVVDIGDVNIQFPDTLLWKRRFMRIDDQGFLILTPPTMEANKRGISRRFHLSDIKRPCLPALEREELPWSILLDFEDGSCLQCACESRYAQGQVLRSGSPRVSILIDNADWHHSAHRRTCCISVTVCAVLIPLDFTATVPSANTPCRLHHPTMSLPHDLLTKSG